MLSPDVLPPVMLAQLEADVLPVGPDDCLLCLSRNVPHQVQHRCSNGHLICLKCAHEQRAVRGLWTKACGECKARMPVLKLPHVIEA